MRIVGSGDKEIWWVRGYNGRVGQDGMGIGQLGRALGSRREGRGPSLRVLSLPFHSCPSIPLRPGSLSFQILLPILLLPLFLHHCFQYFYTTFCLEIEGLDWNPYNLMQNKFQNSSGIIMDSKVKP